MKASMRIRQTARKAITDYVSGLSRIRARAGDRTEIAHLQDRADMAQGTRKQDEEKSPLPSRLGLRPQDLRVSANPGFIDDIVRELTEGE
jgi:hypothetical protein